MKKIVSLFLILSLLLSTLFLFACGEKPDGNKDGEQEQGGLDLENTEYYASFTSYGDGTCALNNMAVLNAKSEVLQIPEQSPAGDSVVFVENLNVVGFPPYLTEEQYTTFSEAVKAVESPYNFNKYFTFLFKAYDSTADAEFVAQYPLLKTTKLYIINKDSTDKEKEQLASFAKKVNFDLTKAVEDLNKLAYTNGLVPDLLLASSYTSITFPNALLEISYKASQYLSKLSYYQLPSGVLISGSPSEEVTENKDLSPTPFTSVCFVNETGNVEAWQTTVVAGIKKYQKSTTAITSQTAKAGACKKADLIIVSYGESALSQKTPADSFRRSYIAVLKDIRVQNPEAVIVLCSVNAVSRSSIDAPLHASYNALIKSMTVGSGLLYADIYSSQALAKWTANDDEVISDRLISTLGENCFCMSLSSGDKKGLTGKKTLLSEVAIQSQINDFASASNAKKLKQYLDADSCYLDVEVYNKMTETQREAVAEQFFANKPTENTTSTEANLTFLTACYQVAYSSASQIDNTPDDFKKIVIVGDSITAGVGATTSENRWVAMVYDKVKKATGNNKIVLDTEYSISGTKLTDETNNKVFPAMNTLTKKAILDKNPDMLWIAYGINDLNGGVSYDTYYSAFDAYLQTIRNALPNCVIVVVGLTYLGNDGNSALVQQYNLGYRKLAEKYGCAYADVYNQLQGSEWLLADGLHPTDIGYYVMADAIYSAILSKCNLKNVAW